MKIKTSFIFVLLAIALLASCAIIKTPPNINLKITEAEIAVQHAEAKLHVLSENKASELELFRSYVEVLRIRAELADYKGSKVLNKHLHKLPELNSPQDLEILGTPEWRKKSNFLDEYGLQLTNNLHTSKTELQKLLSSAEPSEREILRIKQEIYSMQILFAEFLADFTKHFASIPPYKK
ncbi:MAG: hypothetical protein GY793_09655 [Proteobacteria bacterium]|nr:hypothetical protein [Pseudomonadota bacterium]